MDTNYTVRRTRSGHITCEVRTGSKSIFLHSSYDPAKEANHFVKNHISQIKGKKKIFIYGMGCGYHIAALLQGIADDAEVTIDIWDFNVALYELLKDESPVRELMKDSRLTFHVTNNKTEIIDCWSQMDVNNDYILLHPASLEIIPAELSDLKEALGILQINSNNILINKDILNEQFVINLKAANIDKEGILYHLLPDLPVVLAGAGPSLEKNYKFLKKYKEKVLIAAVGNALGPLISQGIIPDFFVLTDACQDLYKQFYQIDKTVQREIPLFYLGTVAPEVVAMYAGSKIMLLQDQFRKANQLAAQLGIIPVKTGGSVATMLLDFSIYLGAKQVCFVGQDLAFTDNKTHIEGAMGYKTMKIHRSNTNLIEIDDYFLQKKVYAPQNLYIYKKWIENYIKDHPDIQFFKDRKSVV